MEQLGAGSRPEGVEAIPKPLFEFIGTHGMGPMLRYHETKRAVRNVA